ncbi:MAG TPA: NAD-dependent epimerase/dehydratase family protein, partial [Angustibacter sp.]|nr:NAD-dependent epimerase/dehydratase family protein [Angustibacter sp.]
RLDPERCAEWSAVSDDIVESTAELLHGADVVVNAAGDPDASSVDVKALNAANGWLPLTLALAAQRAGAGRFVHVSSAVVQGRRPCLDETDAVDLFSPYSRSKALGEDLLANSGLSTVVIYRPPSVHDADRRVTRMTSRIAASRLATVLAPGTQPTPQVLLPNVAAAVAYLATCEEQPPRRVMHPWEGLTAAGLMRALGGRRPMLVPRWLGAAVLASLRVAGKLSPGLGANARRVEMLWAGQQQATSWLSTRGWQPPVGMSGWDELGRRVLDRESDAPEGNDERG